MLRKRLNQEWVRSTTQRRAFSAPLLFLLGLGFFAPRADVGHQTVGVEDVAHFLEVIALVQAEVTQVVLGGGRLDGDALQGFLKQLEVVAVGPSHRQADRHAATLHEQRAFGARFAAVHRGRPGFFPPPREPWSSPHPCSSKSSQCPERRRRPPSPPARSAGRSRPRPMPGNGRAPWRRHKVRWPRARSTGSPFAARKRSPPRTPGPARGAARRPAGACCDARAKAARSAPKARRSTRSSRRCSGCAWRGDGGGLFSWQVRSSPTCIVSRHPIIRIGS